MSTKALSGPGQQHHGGVNAATMTIQEGDDAVRRVLAGETEAFAMVVRGHQRAVWAVVRAMLGDEALGETLVQQTFVTAYERLRQYRFGDLAPWLKAIARNLVRQELRRGGRERQRLHRYHDYLTTLYEDDDNAEIHARDLEKAVATCRDDLPAQAVEALTLYYDQGFDLARVAASVGRSVVATRQLLYRTRAAVRLCVERKMATE